MLTKKFDRLSRSRLYTLQTQMIESEIYRELNNSMKRAEMAKLYRIRTQLAIEIETFALN